MSAPKDPPKRPAPVPNLRPDSGGASGYDLAANVLVGFGLGWLLQRHFSGLKPWGVVGGIVLGAVSGFYQLFKTSGRSRKGPDSKGRH